MSRMTPKAAQQMMQTHGHTYIGMAPKPGFPGAAAPPRPIRDIGTGAPPFNPNNPRATTPNPTPPRGGGGFPKQIPTPRMRMMASGAGMKKGGSVSSASKRADGIAAKGKTKGKIV